MAEFYRLYSLKFRDEMKFFASVKVKFSEWNYVGEILAAASERELLNFNPILNKIAQKILKA